MDPFPRPSLPSTEQSLLQELAREQVRHVDLSEYQIGSLRYELLQRAMSDAQRFQWPQDGYWTNV